MRGHEIQLTAVISVAYCIITQYEILNYTFLSNKTQSWKNKQKQNQGSIKGQNTNIINSNSINSNSNINNSNNNINKNRKTAIVSFPSYDEEDRKSCVNHKLSMLIKLICH